MRLMTVERNAGIAGDAARFHLKIARTHLVRVDAGDADERGHHNKNGQAHLGLHERSMKDVDGRDKPGHDNSPPSS
jgi:hypothetical protein